MCQLEMLLIHEQQTDENATRKLLASVKETNIALFCVVVVVAANFGASLP